MTRASVALLVLLVLSSLALIRSAYDSRRLFAEIHKAELEALRLEGESKRLEAERQAQATSLRVERSAREKLAMRVVTPAVTMYVVDPALAPAPGAASAPASASGGSR